MDDIWDSERIATVGNILSRVSKHLECGDRIRLGMEGDPCYPYRAAEEAPRGTVLSIERDEKSGSMSFIAQLDDTLEQREFSDASVHPEKLWEIAPDHVSVVRSRVTGDSDGDLPAREEEQADYKSPDEDNAFRSSMTTSMDALQIRVSQLESTLASTVREVCADMLRGYRGEKPEFSETYADRYDMAMEHAEEKEYQGTAQSDKKQSEKTSFSEFKGIRYEEIASDVSD